MNGTQKDMVPSYLDEVMWQERFGATFNILCHIAKRYSASQMSMMLKACNAWALNNLFQGH